ncbi:LytTR family DNA-binding domain-containing protein [uncultured Oscillibacter sp.]|uniref:LytR/AlgR family response regulator transcription factor n=1 Tax=uncultured Oscillibacter sp. TaxID=876091 RepID=UPI0025F54B7B|nr:LytTR family DNA-binding domain-containing protein [uncultured Oscillibacter sp.]
MFHIVLCDDEAEERARIGDLLRAYLATRPGLAASRLTVTASGAELLDLAERGADFDLYVLDILMPGLSGIELGLKLRELGRDAPIVYLSVSPDYAVDSYLAQAFYYLLKPVDRPRLFGVLDQAAALLEKRRSAAVQVRTRGGVRLLQLDEILYTELANRAARYYLAGGEAVDSVTLQGSFLSAVEPLLADPRFVLCGSSFAVNLHYVTAVDRGELTLRGGRRVPLSRRLSTQVKKRWGDYWLRGGDGPC